jgi:Type VI secretion system/phage-baseplate injector OB domain
MTPPVGAPAPPGARAAVASHYFGKYPGFVVDRAPTTGASHHRGELRVRVPGILEEDGSGGQQPLEAVATPAFMPGLFWVPEVGDPVWVEFAAGDVNHPIWTGVWYPTDATPANADGDRPTEDQKVVRTPSGQVVFFDDTAGSEKLVLKDEKNQNQVVLDSNGMKLETSSCSIELTASGVKITNGAHTLEMTASAVTVNYSGLGAQPLVLAPLLDWLQTHQHIGNMGAPTPLFPADLAMLLVPAPPKKSGT